jgi:hypothetical protein
MCLVVVTAGIDCAGYERREAIISPVEVSAGVPVLQSANDDDSKIVAVHKSNVVITDRPLAYCGGPLLTESKYRTIGHERLRWGWPAWRKQSLWTANKDVGQIAEVGIRIRHGGFPEKGLAVSDELYGWRLAIVRECNSPEHTLTHCKPSICVPRHVGFREGVIQEYPRPLIFFEMLSGQVVGLSAFAPQKNIYASVDYEDRNSGHLNDGPPLYKGGEALLVGCGGWLLATYVWVRLRRGSLGVSGGLLLTAFGLTLVFIGTILFLSWEGSRIDYQILNVFQQSSDMPSEVLRLIIHPSRSLLASAKVAL